MLPTPDKNAPKAVRTSGFNRQPASSFSGPAQGSTGSSSGSGAGSGQLTSNSSGSTGILTSFSSDIVPLCHVEDLIHREATTAIPMATTPAAKIRVLADTLTTPLRLRRG